MDPLTIAGLASSAAGLAGKLFGGRKKKKKGFRYGLNQQLQQAAGGGQNQWSDLFSPFDTGKATDVFNQQYRDPAMQKFKEEVIPAISGQFRGANLGDSSYHGSALAKSGTDLEKNLDALLSQYLQSGEQQSVGRRQKLLNLLLQLNPEEQQDYLGCHHRCNRLHVL